jgi:hypothetical protein
MARQRACRKLIVALVMCHNICTATAPLCDRLQPNCDVTLREVLQHPAGVKFFKDFLIIRSVLRFHLTSSCRCMPTAF